MPINKLTPIKKLTSIAQQQGKRLTSQNPLMHIYKLAEKIPNQKARTAFLSTLFGKVVPYTGTSDIIYEEFTPNRIVVSVKNKPSVRNHIGQVHAVCMTLLAETATGFLVALNMPADRINLIKSCHVDFLKPSKGDITAVATLTDEQIQFIKDNPKGELLIPCIVSDEHKQPITVEMLWAWIPRSELASRREGRVEDGT